MAWGDLAVESQSLELTPDLARGLTAITVLAFISFSSSSILFSHLAYKLIWYLHIKKRPAAETTANRGHEYDHHEEEHANSSRVRVDFMLGIDGIFDDNTDQSHQRPGSHAQNLRSNPPRRPPNQFLILIINLVLADMHQGISLLLNAAWLRHGTIRVSTPTCFAQGLFVSTGNLASSCFITTIAVHTYLSVVRRYVMPHRVLYLAIAAIWLSIYAISTIPIAATRNGAQYGGFFVRAGAWCWMNIAYTGVHLITHSLFIFIALTTTSALYTAIVINLRRQASSSSAVSQLHFLIYPVIYILCTLPLTAGRIATMAGADVPPGYMCLAGGMMAVNGMLDCILLATTRRAIVFASKHDIHCAGVGLETFDFMQTPRTRLYGNMIWVQGGAGAVDGEVREDTTTTVGWWPWQRLGGGGDDTSERVVLRGRGRAESPGITGNESLQGSAAIQMDTVTSVVFEIENKDVYLRYPDRSVSASPVSQYPGAS